MIKVLIGGSPCTHWSIAQSKNRETKPEGVGWELFENYLIAKEKFKPDLFLYENNKSISPTIKEQISAELGVPFQTINSALVSAQNRWRCYWHNFGDVPQPEDRGIFLKDILETGLAMYEKAYTLTASYNGAVPFNTFERHQREMVAEPIPYCDKAYCLRASAGMKQGESNLIRHITSGGQYGYMGTPVRIGFQEANYDVIDGATVYVTDERIRQGDERGTKQGKYVYLPTAKKTNVISAGQAHNEKVLVPLDGGKAKTVYQVENGLIGIKGVQYPIKLPNGLYFIRKLTVTECCRLQTMPDDYFDFPIVRLKEIILCESGVPSTGVRIPLRRERRGCVTNIVCDFGAAEQLNCGENSLTSDCLARSRVVIKIGKQLMDTALCITKDGNVPEIQSCVDRIMEADTSRRLQAMTTTVLSIDEWRQKCLDANSLPEKSSITLILINEIIEKLISLCAETPNTRVCIKGCGESYLGLYPNSLKRGLSYSKTETTRLISDCRCFSGLGNGWTSEVVIHLLSHGLKNVPRNEPITVLSMYDGIGTGRYCFDKMGFTNVGYHAYEIDKFAMSVAASNYSDIRQHGDAFQVRSGDWDIFGERG